MQTETSLSGLAKKLKDLDARISALSAEEDALRSERDKVSDAIVKEVEGMGGSEPVTALELEGIGVIKVETKAYPRVVDIQAFTDWCKENNVQSPALSVNANTLQAWWREQTKINQPLPPENIAPVYWKSRAKINKSL